MTAHRHLRRITALAAVAAGIALSGCSSAASPEVEPVAAEPAESTASTRTLDPVSGEGPTGFPGVAFPIPENARSVSIAFHCDGDGAFSVELGDSMMLGQSPLSGTCGEPHSLSWPIESRTAPTLVVQLDAGAIWTAKPTFSTAEFAVDEALVAECAAFSEVSSALMNADVGLTQYAAFDETAWRERVQGATVELGELAAASTTELSAALTQLHGELSATTPAPGTAYRALEPGFVVIGAACAENQSPIVLHGEFGG